MPRKKPKALRDAEAVRSAWHRVESAKRDLRELRRQFNLALAQMNATLGRAR